MEKTRDSEMSSDASEEEIKQLVKKVYGKIASSCCTQNTPFCGSLENYSPKDLENMPPSATNVAAGCGNPTGLADIGEGETVLDLGSGAGLDAFLVTKKVGPSGKVVGIDLTEEMIQTAQENAKKLAIQNVEFKVGEIENLPLNDKSVDVIISNCVINMSLNKDRVFREAFRVLKHGGRMIISDIIRRGKMLKELKESPVSWAACAAGALTEREYIRKIRKAGFEKVQVLSKTMQRAASLEIDSPQAQDLVKRFGSCIPKAELKKRGRIIAIGATMKGTASKFDGKFFSIEVKATKQ
jgi:arsenite methyltransferase